MLNLADADMRGPDDTVASTAANMGGKVLDKGLASDYAALVVVPIVAAAIFIAIWRWGGGKERSANSVKLHEHLASAMQCGVEIAQIHERVINKSPAEYQETLRSKPDRSPSMRLRSEASPKA